MRSLRRRWAVVVVATLALSLGAPTSEAAYFPCDVHGTYGRGWSSGALPQTNHFEGASANLVYRNGAVCGADGTAANASLVWTMVADGNGRGWAQSGRIYRPDLGCWRHFAQQLRLLGLYPPHTVFGACTSAGQVFHVWQQTVYVGGSVGWAIRSNINLTILLDSSREASQYGGPWSHIGSWTAPYIVQFAGEAKYNNSDIPGYATAKSDFSPPGQTPMQVQDLFTDQWHNTCGYVSLAVSDADPLNRYAADAPSCSNVRTWTK